MDLGIYCINATRQLFRAEPEEVTALGASANDARLTEVHEMASVVLKFPEERLAMFTHSVGTAEGKEAAFQNARLVRSCFISLIAS
jgi:predicted dehydrogenase